MAATARKIQSHGGVRNQPDNGKVARSQYGNDEEYLTGRIQRDAPEVFEKLLAGKYESVRKAAFDAGIIKRGPKTISLGRDIRKVATHLKDTYSREQVQELVQVLTEGGE